MIFDDKSWLNCFRKLSIAKGAEKIMGKWITLFEEKNLDSLELIQRVFLGVRKRFNDFIIVI